MVSGKSGLQATMIILSGLVFHGVSAQSDADLRNAGENPGEWLTYGFDYGETRFNTLDQINEESVADLGLAWSYDTGTFRGLEATPLVHDGVMYASASWSVVFAVDARTGEELWRFDPGVDRSMGWKACCDVVNRGVALYEGKVFVGALDGRLIALDAQTGDIVWEVMTVDPDKRYTITGAPRIAEGKVLIGNGGAELGARGYLTAYDADTGAEAWRFWVVPGNPADGFENEDMEFAATTWSGEWWQYGGGGNPWDSIIFDPDARLVYVGTGNGSPWSHDIRSNGEGDNLYLSSIVALHVDTGRVAWHYQTTPADNFDYTAVQPLMFADIEFEGETRQVIMQAPKNGFFYVLDRYTGELLSAEPYAHVTWASGIDPESGRPIETVQARYGDAVSLLSPGPGGAHNWHPMSYNPNTGLLYLPSMQGGSFPYVNDPEFDPHTGNGGWNTGVIFGSRDPFPQRLQLDPGTGPDHHQAGALLAWDPIAQEEVWSVDYPFTINGGTLTTAGNLVFQGAADGIFRVFAADDGELLWQADLGVGIMAAPMTYMLDEVQYVSVLVGWGGASGLIGASPTGNYKPEGRLWTFRLGGEQDFEPVQGQPLPELTQIDYDNDPEIIARGSHLYGTHCLVCHGAGAVSGGSLADLRYASEATYDIFDQIVRDGAYQGLGMPRLADVLSEEDSYALRQYLLSLRASLLE